MNNIFGISLLSQASYVSIVHEGKPVVIGKKFHKIHEFLDLAPSKTTTDPDIEQVNNLRCQFLWAHSIIARAFPEETVFKCVISHPSWMGFKYKSLLGSTAKECGLEPLCLSSNLDIVGLYAENLLQYSQDEFWLFVSCDHREIAVSIHVIGDGVIEVLATRYLLNGEEPFSPSNDMKIVGMVVNDAFNVSNISSEQISHCMICAENSNLQEIRELISKILVKSSASILHEGTSIALATALRAGICSGSIVDKLPLFVTPAGQVWFKLYSESAVSSSFCVDGDNYSDLEPNEMHCFMPSNVTYPTMKSEQLSITTPSDSSVDISFYEIYSFSSGEWVGAEIGRTTLSNDNQEKTSLLITMTIDIDAYSVISSKIGILAPDKHNIRVTSGYFGLCSDASYVSIITSSSLNNDYDAETEIRLNELDYERKLTISKQDAERWHFQTLLINDDCEIGVSIPAGINQGGRIRIIGKGRYQPSSGMRGDLYLRIVFREEAEEENWSADDFVKYAKNTKSFNGSPLFNRVLSYIQDVNSEKQLSSNKKRNVFNALSSIGAIGATATGLGGVAAALSLARLASLSNSNKSVWSNTEINQIREVFETSQNGSKSLTARLGQPLGRFIRRHEESWFTYSVFQSTNRGFNLVTLIGAHQIAKCFTDENIHSLIQTVVDKDDEDLYWDLLNSYYPIEVENIKGIRLVKDDEARENAPDYQILAEFGAPYRFDFSEQESFYAYKLPIPHHSDY